MTLSTIAVQQNGTSAAVTVTGGASVTWSHLGSVGSKARFSDKLVAGVAPGHESLLLLSATPAKNRSTLATVPVSQRLEGGSGRILVPRFDVDGAFLGNDAIELKSEFLNSTSIADRKAALCAFLSIIPTEYLQYALVNAIIAL